MKNKLSRIERPELSLFKKISIFTASLLAKSSSYVFRRTKNPRQAADKAGFSRSLNKKYLVLLAILIIPAVEFLFWPGYFNMHDDLQVMRLLQMDKCFADGQIPCRWSPDMAYGFGQPMFNFYSVIPYYLGAFMRMLTPLTYLGTVKMLFLISFLIGAVGMYLLVNKIWGKSAGLLSAVLYTYAPYHALDVYVRGALAESFALGLLPFLWHSIYILINKPNYPRLIYASLIIAAVLATHNISTMLYAPITLIWALYWIISKKKYQSIKALIISGNQLMEWLPKEILILGELGKKIYQ